ncbi:hypothetical protein CN598_12760 [Bacillus wiedmannii]|nr:hypothetical protein CN598_12760 [Bacillus wiedmannii]
MYQSKLKSIAYELRKLGLGLDSALARIKMNQLVATFKYINESRCRNDLRGKLFSIGGKWQ